MNFDLLLSQYYDLFRRFYMHFVSGADLEDYLADDSHIAHTWSLRSLYSYAFSGFCTLTLKLTQHFDLIYNIGIFDWNILPSLMKTAQDSYTISIKQIVRFQEKMHPQNFQLEKFKIADNRPLFSSTGQISGKSC